MKIRSEWIAALIACLFISPLAQATTPTFDFTQLATGSGSGYTLDINKIHVPIGWGYMTPHVVVDGEDQYALSLTSCASPNSADFGKTYCGYLLKNGQVFDVGFGLGVSYSGLTASYAYQTPMLFKRDRKLYLAYWMMLSTGSAVNLISLDMDASAPRSWTHKATYHAPSGGNFNYLGGGMGPDGTIVIAGYANISGAYSLQVVSIAPPYTSFTGPVTAYASGGVRWTPVYSHVAVDQNGTIDLFFTLHNGTACSETGVAYTAYKNLVSMRGTMSGGFTGIWSDGAPDVIADTTYYWTVRQVFQHSPGTCRAAH